jgi:hypothetical protein
MPSSKYFYTRRVLSKKTALLFIVVAAIFSLYLQNSAARQSPSRRVTAGSPISPRAMRRQSAAATRQLPTPREDFDLRVGHQRSLSAPPESATAKATPQSAQASRLKQARPGVRIKWSSLTGAPSRVSSHTEALNDPIAAEPGSAARNFLKGSEGEKIVFWGDIMQVADAQFPNPSITIIFDVDSKAAAAERRKAYADAAKSGYLVAAAHVSFPGVGHIRTEGDGYRWIPIPYVNDAYYAK